MTNLIQRRIRIVPRTEKAPFSTKRWIVGNGYVGRFGILAVLLVAYPPIVAGTGQQVARVTVGDQAIGFKMQSIDGETFRLSDLRGEKAVILIFFRGAW